MKKALITFLIFITVAAFVKPAAALAATLSLSPASGVYQVGSIFGVDIVLDTGTDAVSGATAILNYDTTRLQVQDDNQGTAGVQIAQGTIFNQTPLTNSVDATAGQIRYDSGSLGTSYTGHGTMATIHFKTLAAGTAAVTYVFNSSTTINTSLVAAATGPTNLLTTVQDGNYTIATGSGTTTTTTQQTLLATGVVENTLMALAGGFILVALGLLFAR